MSLCNMILLSREDLLRQYGSICALVPLDGSYAPATLHAAWTTHAHVTSDIIYAVCAMEGEVVSPSDAETSPSYAAPWCVRNLLALLAVRGAGLPTNCGEELEGRVVKIWLMGSSGRDGGAQGM